jgi:hypothetical protein
MRVDTCCPHEGCGAFQEALNWLRSWGIEPAIEFNDGHHYFEFDFPDDWEKAQRIEFRWDLCKRTSGTVICRCGLWLDDDYLGEAILARCDDCGREFLFCTSCNPIEEWGGCDCGIALFDGDD